ncbi:MAG: 30S ribosomal protein S12 methylthiotransferase RimO [Kiritimatiellae bacterium]|nr:30S ribosomal protein S12 methylthiotransferase RimO [Kiritimatiellia bacterium]
MSLSVGFISLGCSKNLVDTQVMAGFLKEGKITLAHSPEEADVILVNTCAFIQDARDEAAEVILQACEQKKRGLCRAVIVTGCMVQRYRDKLAEVFPNVDAFLGVDNLEAITDIVKRLETGTLQKRMVATSRKPHKLYNPAFPTLIFSGGPFGYLKIAEGCDHRCAFCAIPGIRGAYRSRRREDLIKEATSMLDAGVKELNLIAQDVMRYGTDLSADHKPQLVALLREIDGLDGDFWFRLLYGYPSAVTDELLELLATSRHACRYLDVPIQHISPKILRAMGRADAIEGTLTLTERLRKAVPGITLRTTCLVGFPGETDRDFEELLEFICAAKFDHLGVFPYSPEDGTRAFDLPDLPPLEVADERAQRLLAAQRRIVRERAKNELVGIKGTALLIRKQQNGWIARLPRQAPDVDGVTYVTGVPEKAIPGTFCKVRITRYRGYDLYAERVSR